MSGEDKEKNGERIRMTAAVAPQHGGARLDQVAAELFPDYSRARLQKWIHAGQLTVNGQKAKPTYKVTMGETLLLDAEAEQEGRVAPQDIPLDLLYADDDILVVNKPAGMVVHPAAGNPDGTLQNALLFFDPAMDALPRSGIVHRLDKETSGVMVVARSLRAHAALVRQLQERTMSRIYRAVALGDIVAGGKVDAPIGRHPVDRKRMAVVTNGRPAVTHYRVLERFGGATYVEVSLETGRTHQIRVHMAKLGHPLAGDPQYGRRKPAKAGLSEAQWSALESFPRQALHAMRLVLQHPVSGEEMRFEAPLPEDFLGLLEVLQADQERVGDWL